MRKPITVQKIEEKEMIDLDDFIDYLRYEKQRLDFESLVDESKEIEGQISYINEFLKKPDYIFSKPNNMELCE